MLTSIQLREEDNTTLISLRVGAPSSSTGLFIKKVDGLGPVKANISTTSFANYDGGIYQSSRTDSRNIVMTLGMTPQFDYQNDVSSLRDVVYSYFPPKGNATLVLVFDNFAGGNAATRKITGIVESVEPVIFSEQPEVQVSIMCPQPYFKNYSSFTIDGETGVPLDTSLFGTAPAGFIFDITLVSSASRITMETEFDEPLVWEGALSVGDRLRISTLSGGKYALLTPSGNTSSVSVLDGIVSGSMSMSLDRRTKSFIVNRETGTGTQYRLFYVPEYVGV